MPDLVGDLGNQQKVEEMLKPFATLAASLQAVLDGKVKVTITLEPVQPQK